MSDGHSVAAPQANSNTMDSMPTEVGKESSVLVGAEVGTPATALNSQGISMEGAQAAQGMTWVLAVTTILFFALLIRSLGRKRRGNSTSGKISELTENKTVPPMSKAEPPVAPLSLPPISPETPTTSSHSVEPALASGSTLTSPSVSASASSDRDRATAELSLVMTATRTSIMGRIKSIFLKKEKLAPHELDELEEILYTSDLGPRTVERLMEAVNAKMQAEKTGGIEAVREALKSEMLNIFATVESGAMSGEGVLEHLAVWNDQPAVLMVVGVNGAGKTTTIGKLASLLAQNGKSVLVAAGDTFRAAAGGQLKVWTERAKVEIFSPEGVSDPSAVAFKALETAAAKKMDVVIVDTAGRLHTQKNLMEELKKMKRVMQKLSPAAPHEILLVLDSNSGQNALIQAREFHDALGVTGVVLTKLDGSAKGGVAVGVACEMKLPIKLIGVGERIEDLRRFSSSEFVASLF